MVYQKLDYYTVICYNRTLRYCLDKIDLFDESIEMLQGDDFRECHKYEKSYKTQIGNIFIEIKTENFADIEDLCQAEDLSFVDCTLDYIRIEMSGSALEWLRERGFNPDIAFHDIDYWGELGSYNVTRCDFAFDFVNCHETFMADLFEWVRNEQRDPEGYLKDWTSRLRCHRPGGNSYKMLDSNRIKCFYIGSPSSEKFLRIYDKLLEKNVKNNSLVPDENPFPAIFQENETEQINSWFRIELQARTLHAMKLLYQPLQVIDEINHGKKDNIFSADGDAGYYDYVLRYIFEHYMILDRDYNPIPCMAKLFNWSALPKLVRNSYLVQCKTKNHFLRTQEWVFKKNITSLLALIGVMGMEQIEELCKNELHRIQTDDSDKSKCQNRALRKKLSSFLVCLDKTFSQCYFQLDKNNHLIFKNTKKESSS